MINQPIKRKRSNLNGWWFVLLPILLLLANGLILAGVLTRQPEAECGADVVSHTQETAILYPTLTPPPLTSTPNYDEIKRDLLFQANQAYMSHEFHKAITLYQEYITYDSTDKEAYNFLGWSYIGIEDYETALDIFDSMIERYPDYSGFYWGRGFAYREMEAYDLAIQDYNRAIELDPNNDSLHINLANIYSDLEEYDTAMRGYLDALLIDPIDADIYNGLGFVELKRGNWQDSLDYLNRAIELNPVYAYAYNNRGYVLVNMGRHNDGFIDIDHSLELDDTNELAYQFRGFAYFKLGYYDRAIADYTYAIELGDDDADAYKGIGEVYDAIDEYTHAVENYEIYLELAGDSADPVVIERVQELRYEIAQDIAKQARVHTFTGDYEEAIRLYHESIEIFSMPETYMLLARAYGRNEDYDTALSILDDLIQHHPALELRLYLERGDVYSHQSDYWNALGGYTYAISRIPSTGNHNYKLWAHKARARAYAKLDMYEQAIKICYPLRT